MGTTREGERNKILSEEEREKIRRGVEGLKNFNSILLDEPELSLEKKFDLLDAMHEFSREMGAFSGEDPLKGIEVKIKIAKVVSSVS
ncbi:MAG: hypothetical protein GF372_07645 [Candidatus Marinimicrobia bacterium]|nr:hypothetical protein [Candidatus Neomarinimicrobiota bacterium]